MIQFLIFQVPVPMWAFLLVGLGVPITSVINTVLNHYAASRAATAATKAAVLVEGVKKHLEVSEKKTDGKLSAIEAQNNKIHYLVNNNLSEQLKQKLYMANLLIRQEPDNEEYQELHMQAVRDVAAHARPDSSKED